MFKGVFGRKDRLVQQKRHDVYRSGRKLPEPTVCPDCNAVFSGGRWNWSEANSSAKTSRCPACQRIADNLPAGIIKIRGSFVREHRDELVGLIRNTESLEKGAHPLERIMSISDQGDGLQITTTGVHVARRIGDALSRSYHGSLDYTYGDAEKSIQVSWVRDSEA